MARRVDDRWFLPLEGLASGFLTCLVPTLPLGLGRASFLFVGLVFGVAISAHVRSFRGMRSASPLIGFIATCTVAYTVAVFATMRTPFRPQFLNFSGTGSAAIDSSGFFTGGFVGAAIMCAGMYFFLAPQSSLAKFLLKAFSISVACGFLGVLGWSVGQRSWNARWLPGFGTNLNFYALYIIWQTGAASLLGLLLSPQQTPSAPPPAALPAYVPLQTKAGRATRPVGTTIFLVLVLGTLAWFIVRQVRGDLAARRMQAARQAAQQQLAAAQPLSQNLPAVVAQPVDHVLVLRPIAGHPCGLSFGGRKPTGRPESVGYMAEYKRSATAGDEEASFADVEVILYPNSDWAVYATKQFMWDSAAENPQAVTTVTKFRNKVIMNTLQRYPNGGGDLYFYWASGNRFVKVTFHASEEDEFLKEYLVRYPSTG